MGVGMADAPATIIAEWPINSREHFHVSIEQFQGTWIFSARRWFEADDGSMRPSKRGFSIGLKHLPAIAENTARALAVARERGLLEFDGTEHAGKAS
jgi:Transcriptional Coactivator p15 (PC4)